jgi:VanZ family protein
MSKYRFFLPAALYYGLIFFLSAQSSPQLPFYFPFVDKVLHFILYTGFGICLAWGFARLDLRDGRPRLALVLAVGALLSGLDEIHQIFVPGRSAEVADAVVDVLGILAGGVVVRWVCHRRTARARRRSASDPGTPLQP